MFPEFDVATSTHVDLEALRPPSSVRSAGSIGFNGSHFDLTRTSWDEALETLAVESQWLAESDEASTTVDACDDPDEATASEHSELRAPR